MNTARTRTLRIVRYPDPLLKTPARPIEEFGPKIAELAARMLDLLPTLNGVGLAGPQVGVLLRIFVCNPTGNPDDAMICTNPRLTDLSGSEMREEGCLSIPEVSVHMRRATRAVLHAFDPEGRPFERTGIDLLARIWQHEIDHLDGKLITDHMSTADEIANRKALRKLREEYRRHGKKR
jgi:peptide deformylase